MAYLLVKLGETPSDPPEREHFYTVAEVAAILRVNPQTVRKLIQTGDIPCTRVGRRYLIPQSYVTRVTEAAQGEEEEGE